MAGDWMPLPSSNCNNDSVLIVKCSFGQDGYDLCISDLNTIWREALSRDEFLQRAKTIGSSIDPSHDQEQFNILLEKIQAALEGSEDTKLDLNFNAQTLYIDLTTLLPKPLAPLEWPFQLSRMSEEFTKQALFVPLLGLSFVQKQQMSEMSAFLAEKDTLISRILDKVQSLGLDLTSILPHVGTGKFGKKTNQREQLANHVRGLAPFEKSQYLSSSLAQDHLLSESLNEFLKKSLEGTNSPAVNSVARLIQPGCRLVKDTLNTGERTSQTSQFESQGFQRQLTPTPSNKAEGASQHRASISAMPRRQTASNDNESTEDDEEARPIGTAKSMDTHNNSDVSKGQVRTKLGTIGGQASKAAAKDTDPKIKSEPLSDEVTGATDQPEAIIYNNSSTGEAAGGTSVEKLAIQPATARASGKKLGRIGGKKSEAPPLAAHDSRATDSLPEGIKEPLPESAPTPRPVDLKTSTGDANEPSHDTSTTPETAEQKANLKREELKRQLEDRARAQGKKKRKF